MDSTVALDADLALYRLELRRQPELWSDSGRPQLRASEVQVVPALEDMIREFVPRREAHAARRPISIDDIAAGDFRLFAAILREAGNHERVAVRAEHRTAAFVKPLRRNAHDAGRRFSASQPVSKHADAVGRRVLGLLRVVHRVAVFRASQVGQAGARHQAACRLDGVIDWRQQLPGRVPLIHLVVVDDLAGCAMCDELGECSSRVHGRRCQGMRRHRVLEQSKVRFVDERDTPPSPVSELNDAAHESRKPGNRHGDGAHHRNRQAEDAERQICGKSRRERRRARSRTPRRGACQRPRRTPGRPSPRRSRRAPRQRRPRRAETGRPEESSRASTRIAARNRRG